MNCPKCKKDTYHHKDDCHGYFGKVTLGEHYYCPFCMIVIFPDGSWRNDNTTITDTLQLANIAKEKLNATKKCS